MEQRSFDAPSSNTSGLGGTTGGVTAGSSGSGGLAGSPGAQLKEEGRHLADQAAGQIKSRIQNMTDERKSQATGALEAIGRALRTASGNLQEEGLDPVGQLGLQAAEKVDRMADYLRRRDLDSLLSDVQGAARNHPEVFLGGALLCGILIGRFLRSSSSPSQELSVEPDFGAGRGLQGSSPSFGDGHTSGSFGDGHASGASFGDGSSSSHGSDGFGMDQPDRPPQGGWA